MLALLALVHQRWAIAQTLTFVQFTTLAATTAGGAAEGDGKLLAGITYSARATSMDAIDEVALVEGTTVLDSITYNVTRDRYGEPVNTTRSGTRSARLGIGTHSIRLRVHTVDGGMHEYTQPFTVVVAAPNSAPTASLTAPSNGATLTLAPGASSMSIGIAGTGADIDGNLSGLEVKLDGATIHSAGGASVSIGATVGEGSHTVQLIARDAAGLTGSTSVTFTVNKAANSAPTASLSAPSNGASQTLAPGASTVAFNVVGSGADVDGNLSGMEVRLDGTPVFSAGGSSVNTNINVGQGNHTIQLVAKDAAGATGSASVSVTVNPAPNSAPTASLTAPTNGATQTLASGASTVAFNVVGSGADVDGNLSGMEVRLDGTPVFSAGGSSVNTNINVGQGTHTIQLVAKDAAGATGSASVSVTVNPAPNRAPTASLTAPANNATLTLAPGASTVAVNVAGSGADADGNLSGMEIRLDGTSVLTGGGSSVNTSINVGPGGHTIQLIAKDSSGATGTASVSITVNVPGNSAPTASLTAPTNGATQTLASGASTVAFNVIGSGADVDGNLSGMEVRLDGAQVFTGGGSTVNTNINVGQGNHTIQLVAKDAAGATGSASVSVTVNPAANSAPTASLTAPANGATQTLASGASTVAFNVIGSGADVDGNLSGMEIRLDGVPVFTTGGASVNASINVGQGNHTIQLVAKDAAGATGIASVAVTVNAVPDAPIAVSITPPHLGNADAGSLPGKLAIGSNGDSTYSVPLAVPPGTAGMVPELSLNYSSHGTAGIAGLGWSLGGQSSIQRCAKTVAQDGEGGRIRLDPADRLCLDGQRLMRTGSDASDAAYWAANAEYATEIESFARITRQGNGFKVERRNGQIQYYGTDASSLILAQGRDDGRAMSWALARTEDRMGNFVAYAYQTDAATGEYVMSQILYGGNPNAAGATASDLAVRFEYETRPDAQLRYFGGSRTDLRKRLTHVKAFIGVGANGGGGTMVRDYMLSYSISALSGASMLQSLQGCARNSQTGATECLPATTFDYGAAGPLALRPVDVKFPTYETYGFPTSSAPRTFGGNFSAGEFRGTYSEHVAVDTVAKCSQGTSDCPSWSSDPEMKKKWHVFTGKLRLILSDGRVVDRTLPAFVGATSLIVADYNGDGRDDIAVLSLIPSDPGIKAICVNSVGADGAPDFACANWWHAGSSYGGEQPPTVIDLNNDRRAHLIFGHSEDCRYVGGAAVMSCSPFAIVSRTPSLPPYASLLDLSFFNPVGLSLGRQDMSDLYSIWAKKQPTYPSGATGVSYHGVTVCMAGTPTVCETPYQAADNSQFNLPDLWPAGAGDLNGDGLTDFVYTIRGDGTYVCLSKETSIECRKVTTPWPASAYVNLNIGDHLGTGVSLVRAAILTNYPYETPSPPSYVCRFAETALVCLSSPAITSQDVGVRDVQVPAGSDKLIAVTNGVGLREEADYARAVDETVYKTNVVGVQRTYPQIIRSPGILTKTQRHSNGQGGWRSESFFYAGALSDAYGRGSLGFGQIVSTETSSGIATTTDFLQSFPHIGTAKRVVMKAANGVILSDTAFTSEQQTIRNLPGGKAAIFTFVKSKTTTRNDLSADALGTSVETFDYADGWGNLTGQSTQQTLAGKTFSTAVSTTYTNDQTRWLIGLPVAATTARVNPDGASVARITTTVFDPVTGLPRSQTIEPNDPALKVTTTFDRSGNPFGLVNKTIQSWTDPSPVNGGAKTRTVSDIAFDARGRFPMTKFNALGQGESFTYDAATGVMTSHRLVNAQTIVTQVDGFGRVRSNKATDGTTVKQDQKRCNNDCPANAVVAVVTDTFNGANRIRVPSVHYLDSVGHKLRELTWGFDGRQIVADTRYDALGRVYEVDQPHYVGDATYLASRNGYDVLGRVTSVTSRDDDGIERTATTTYRGPIREVRDGKSQLRTETRNAIDQLEQVVDPRSGVTKFGYEPFGNLAKTTDPNGNVIAVGYDRLGRKTTLTDPDLGLIEYGVDPLGRTWSQRSANHRALAGQPITRIEFDLLDRITGRYEPDLESHWIYDTAANGVGQLAEAHTGTPAAKDYRRLHAYDSLSRPTTTTQVLTDASYTSMQAYDTWGRASELTLRRGTDASKTFTQRFNARGYLNRVDRNGTPIWIATEQDALQRLTKSQLGNGLAQLRTYSVHSGRPLTHWLTNASGQLRLSEDYKYDMLGNITRRQLAWDGTGFAETFDYDELNRIKWSQVQGQVLQSFTYDPAGNMTSKTGVGTYAYPAQGVTSVRPHAVLTITDGGSVQSFGYDANGNLQTGMGRTVSWTSFDMPLTITKSGASSATFIYGPEHQRARQNRSDGSLTLYAGAQEVETKAGVTTVRTYWPMGLGFDVDQTGVATKLYWRHTDWLGSPVALSDATGTLVEKMSYDAWGQRRTLDGSATPSSLDGALDNKGFTGHEMLDQLDLVHMNGRIYDPRVARFMSADPLVDELNNGQAYNRFSYVHNNPTNATDPSGFNTIPTELIEQIEQKAKAVTRAAEGFAGGIGLERALGEFNKLIEKAAGYLAVGAQGNVNVAVSNQGAVAAGGDAKATQERTGTEAKTERASSQARAENAADRHLAKLDSQRFVVSDKPVHILALTEIEGKSKWVEGYPDRVAIDLEKKSVHLVECKGGQCSKWTPNQKGYMGAEVRNILFLGDVGRMPTAGNYARIDLGLKVAREPGLNAKELGLHVGQGALFAEEGSRTTKSVTTKAAEDVGRLHVVKIRGATFVP